MNDYLRGKLIKYQDSKGGGRTKMGTTPLDSSFSPLEQNAICDKVAKYCATEKKYVYFKYISGEFPNQVYKGPIHTRFINSVFGTK